jgi:hypothetical protein
MAATADGQEILQRVVRQGKRLRDLHHPEGRRGRAGPVPGRPAGQGMGGRVWVEDNRGGGARLVVELPGRPRCRAAAGNLRAAEGVQRP